MKRLGVFLLGTLLLFLFAPNLKPGYDALYTLMNTTQELSSTEQIVWRAMPYLLPVCLFGICIAVLAGRISKDEEEY